MASLSCPDCGVKVQPEDLICFRCGANLPHASGPDEDLLTPTISQRFIAPGDAQASCPRCGTQFDIVHAGAGPDESHLEPLPLLLRDGVPSVALAEPMGAGA